MIHELMAHIRTAARPIKEIGASLGSASAAVHGTAPVGIGGSASLTPFAPLAGSLTTLTMGSIVRTGLRADHRSTIAPATYCQDWTRRLVFGCFVYFNSMLDRARARHGHCRRGDRMRRREFLAVGSACLIHEGGPAFAEPSKTWRVALLTSGSQGGEILALIRLSLASLGYEEGKNLIIDFREANGRYSVLPDLVADLIARKPDVIIAEATPAVAAAQKATSVIPIVISPATDPVGSGFVQSFAHPGGNITGVANMFGDLTAKTFEVARTAAAAIGIAAEGFIARNPEDTEAAFAQMKEADCEVVYVLADPPRPVLPSIALKFALPTIFQVSSYVSLGGLMSYGPNIPSFFTKAAEYVDRILKGGRPADLPVEQPTTFDFIINLRTAKALGLTIPQQVLLMADQVVE
jgi:ABC-type uncharacterized transport system substrate-binding protein